MTARLTPALALRYLHELSADLRAGVVLDRAGEAVAGDAALVPAARALLSAAGERRIASVRGSDGWVCAASGTAHSIVLACGPHLLVGLLEHDLATVLEDLEAPATAAGEGPAAPASARAREPAGPSAAGAETLPAAAEAVLSAARRGSAI
jgi:hypothetical protein